MRLFIQLLHCRPVYGILLALFWGDVFLSGAGTVFAQSDAPAKVESQKLDTETVALLGAGDLNQALLQAEDLLKSPTTLRKRQIALFLGQRLKDAPPESHVQLLRVLHGCGEELAPHRLLLLPYLQNENPALVKKALFMIGDLGKAGEETEVALLDLAAKGDWRMASAACRAWEMVSPNHQAQSDRIFALIKAWPAQGAAAREFSLSLLEAIEFQKLDWTVPALLEKLPQADASLRRDIWRVLSKIAPKHPGVVEAAKLGVGDASSAVRASVAPLVSASEAQPHELAILLGKIRSTDRQISKAGLDAAIWRQDDAPVLADAIAPLLGSRDSELAEKAALTLRTLGKEITPALDEIVEQYDRLSVTGYSRDHLNHCLKNLGGNAVPALAKLRPLALNASGSVPIERQFQAIEMMGWIGPAAAPEYQGLLQEYRKTQDVNLQAKLILALARLQVAPFEVEKIALDTLQVVTPITAANLDGFAQALVTVQSSSPDTKPLMRAILQELGAQVPPYGVLDLLIGREVADEDVELLASVLEKGTGRYHMLAVKSIALRPDMAEHFRPILETLSTNMVDCVKQFTALQSMMKLGLGSTQEISRLVTMYQNMSADYECRTNALGLIIELGPAAVQALPQLRAGLSHVEPQIAALCATAIGAIGPQAAAAVPDLVKTLSTSNEDLVLASLNAFGKIGPQAKLAIKPLTVMLDSGHPLSWQAGDGLGGIGPAAADAVPILIEHLKNSTQVFRVAAARNLAAIGVQPETVLPALFTALEKERDTTPMIEMLRAIGSFAPDTDRWLTRLEPWTHRAPIAVRLEALRSVGKLNGPTQALLRMLASQANSPDSASRDIALRALTKQAGGAAIAVERLTEALHDADPKIQLFAAESLGRLRAVSGVMGLVNAARSPRLELRWAAIDSLGRIGDARSEVVAVLKEAIASPDLEIQSAAAQAIRKLIGE